MNSNEFNYKKKVQPLLLNDTDRFFSAFYFINFNKKNYSGISSSHSKKQANPVKYKTFVFYRSL